MSIAVLRKSIIREKRLETVLRPGRYRHYKGKYYEVIDVARHSETEERLVVYRCLYGDDSLWARPLTMFAETVTVNGEQQPRFEWCGESSQGQD